MVLELPARLAYPTILYTATTLGILTWFAYKRARKRTRLPLPPGPSNRIPGMGSLIHIPKHKPWEAYARWGKEYNSDVILMQGAGLSIVILNSVQAATDLLVKRSSLFSSRPTLSILDMAGWDYLMSHMQYNSRWRERRKLFQKQLHPVNPEVYQLKFHTAIQERLIPRLLESPEKWSQHFRHMIASASISLAYGIPLQTSLATSDGVSDVVAKPRSLEGLIALAEAANEILNSAPSSGAVMLDIFPVLKYFPSWFPGLDFLAKLPEWRRVATEFHELPFEVGKTLLVEGKAEESFISLCFDEEEQEEVIKDTAATLFFAGVDTTLALLHNFILAMLIHPEVQTRAQEEIDRLLSTDNQIVPGHSGSDKLPYLGAVLKEVLRWRPVVPLGPPHSSVEDDIYKGYHIPKDSVIMPNIWLMSRDERLYGPNTEEFHPERFLDSEGKPNPTVSDPSDICFGFGRRICPGMHIAKDVLFMVATEVLSVFSIKPSVDVKTGEVKTPSMDWSDLVVCPPLPFECEFVPRGELGKM